MIYSSRCVRFFKVKTLDCSPVRQVHERPEDQGFYLILLDENKVQEVTMNDSRTATCAAVTLVWSSGLGSVQVSGDLSDTLTPPLDLCASYFSSCLRDSTDLWPHRVFPKSCCHFVTHNPLFPNSNVFAFRVLWLRLKSCPLTLDLCPFTQSVMSFGDGLMTRCEFGPCRRRDV